MIKLASIVPIALFQSIFSTSAMCHEQIGLRKGLLWLELRLAGW
jgi:hypothetical protein